MGRLSRNNPQEQRVPHDDIAQLLMEALTDPVDETHRQCLAAQAWVRQQFDQAKARAAAWDLPES